MTFFTELKIRIIDGRIIEVLEPFSFVTSEYSITVPSGFKCDGQSYPRIGRFIDTQLGLGGKAGVIHDWLYYLNGTTGIDRKKADCIFYDALVASGLSKWRAYFRYKNLRFFGGKAWAAHTKRRANGELQDVVS